VAAHGALTARPADLSLSGCSCRTRHDGERLWGRPSRSDPDRRPLRLRELLCVGYEATIAGAELPLILAVPALRRPESVGASRVTRSGEACRARGPLRARVLSRGTLAALRLLVERDQGDVVVGPNGPADGLVVRDMRAEARHHVRLFRLRWGGNAE